MSCSDMIRCSRLTLSRAKDGGTIQQKSRPDDGRFQNKILANSLAFFHMARARLSWNCNTYPSSVRVLAVRAVTLEAKRPILSTVILTLMISSVDRGMASTMTHVTGTFFLLDTDVLYAHRTRTTTPIKDASRCRKNEA